MEILQTIHAHNRWLVVMVVVIAALYMLFGALTKRGYDKTAYRVMLAFSSIVGIQWVLGLILFVLMGLFRSPLHWEHAVTNTLALAAAHLHIPMRKRLMRQAADPAGPLDNRLYWIGLLAVGLTMLFVYFGVARLNGWAMS